jgi:hypothetical protein
VKLGAIAAKVAGWLGLQPSDSIVEVLKEASLFADVLKQSFRHQLERFKIVSFWEGEGSVRNHQLFNVS